MEPSRPRETETEGQGPLDRSAADQQVFESQGRPFDSWETVTRWLGSFKTPFRAYSSTGNSRLPKDTIHQALLCTLP